uniref:Electron transfer flavoprotein subunit alpha n=1 Tax=uncultured Thiotrichaceae bacterium TaxID=298394 RepID=A0A6S6UCX8_9GAMM|nr:MAG: Electron transfer flavoprotein, alpha subunit [uncultured Thiotrichaceae bacterium]
MSVLLIAEVLAGELNKDSTAKALSAAVQLGDVDVLCASSGCGDAASELSGLQGVAKVLCANDASYENAVAEPMAALILSLADNYEHIVFPATTSGKNIAPRVAALLDVMVISEVMEVKGANEFVRPIYAGNAIQTVTTADPKKVMTIRTASFDNAEDGGSAAIEEVAAVACDAPVAWVSNEVQESDRPELTSSDIIVSGGRGVGSEEDFALIEALADKLGAAVGASRAAVDAGFAPNDQQVGQTGKIVAPQLYVAVGISGAIQHLAGMKDSKVIVAINKDEDAPIFQVADYGLVADLFDAVPEMTAAL